ncbi:MAG: hypothetical protein KDD40_05265, partial [Bdellovibrionales bacterium]|nr:hypothetical protein [Bdellovibrionales bacterium]
SLLMYALSIFDIHSFYISSTTGIALTSLLSAFAISLNIVLLLNPVYSILMIYRGNEPSYFPTYKQRFSILNKLPEKWLNILLLEKQKVNS